MDLSLAKYDLSRNLLEHCLGQPVLGLRGLELMIVLSWIENTGRDVLFQSFNVNYCRSLDCCTPNSQNSPTNCTMSLAACLPPEQSLALSLSSWMFKTFTVKAIILLAFSAALRRAGLSIQNPKG